MTQADLQERLGEVVGSKYQVLYRLGGGGMSQVFLARHRFHGGLFAIKVLAEHLATDRSLIRRFEREARMTASLANHPNIVSIFDIGEGSGIHYLVMQFVAGEDLGNYLHRAGRLSLVDAANVISQATEALSCAESRRIVHRDLKPSNMLLDETGRVKLLDFGISRIADLSDGLTRPGEAVGTPYYMSPEQIRGGDCDIRSDLYSLGIVFFELLTGHRPFENESATAIQIAHLSAPPPSLLAYDPQLPAACDAIVQKLIAKVPDERFQNTADLLKVLTANGANPTPGALRPAIDVGVQEAIACAQAMPLENATLSSTSSVSSPAVTSEADAPAEALSPMRNTASLAAPLSTTSASPEVPAPVQPSKSKLGLLLAVSAAVVLILALAVGYFALSRRKPSRDTINTITETHQSTEAIAPSPVSSRELTKNVSPAPLASHPIIESFTASPAAIQSGQPIVLQWETKNATKVKIGGIGEMLSGQTNKTVCPTSSHAYVLAASGPGGTAHKTVDVSVTIPADENVKLKQFSADPTEITRGNSSVLRWEVANASSVWIDPGIGQVDACGVLRVAPQTTTVYRLSYQNDRGTLRSGPVNIIVK